MLRIFFYFYFLSVLPLNLSAAAKGAQIRVICISEKVASRFNSSSRHKEAASTKFVKTLAFINDEFLGKLGLALYGS